MGLLTISPTVPGHTSTRRNVAGWLIGFGSSLLADQVFFLALTWAALQLGSPSQVGLVLAAGSVPRLLFLMVGGVFADRVSPKIIIIGTDTGRALVMAGAATVLMFGSLDTVGLIVVALAIGALDGLFLPAVSALPALIAPPHLMGRIAALRTVTQRGAMLIGGPLAGWLIYLYGAPAAFWGSAALFVVSVASLGLVTLMSEAVAERSVDRTDQPAAPQVNSTWRRSVDAIRAARRDPVLPWLLLLIAGMNVGFAGPVTAGIPLLAADTGWGARGAGLLLGSFGLGAALSGLGLVFVKRIPRAGRSAMAGVTIMGVALTALGMTTTFPVALAAMLVLGLASGLFGTVVHSMILTNTPKAQLGRVCGLVSLSIEGVVPVSFAATGVLAGLLGAHATFVIGGLVILAATAVAFSRSSLGSFELARAETENVRAAR